MPLPPEPKREQPGTYFVLDRENQEELKRLQVLDRAATEGMGGVLPEQPDPGRFARVLDVGCGTGGWLIEAAKAYPSMKLLVGLDPSRTFLEYARAQAEAAQVSDRVEFHIADALRMLEFPDHFFDLVNHRFATSWLRTWDWLKLLQEYQRVCRPDGVVRITESDWWVSEKSPALSRLTELTLRASYQAGHSFTPGGDGVTRELIRLLQQHGVQNVQARAYTVTYRAGTPAGHLFGENMRIGFRTNVPFLQKWIKLPDDYEELYQQMLSELQQPDFMATMGLLTVWGNPAPKEERWVEQ